MDLEMALNDLAAHIHPASLAPWYQQCAWYLVQRDALARAQDDQAAAGDEPGPGGGLGGGVSRQSLSHPTTVTHTHTHTPARLRTIAHDGSHLNNTHRKLFL